MLVTPPAKVLDPVTVHVLDYGRHSSLVLPNDDGSAVEFAFGEWNWFARNKTKWWRVPGVLLCCNASTLGRRTLPDADALERLHADGWFESSYSLRVERNAARSLLQRLESEYSTGGASEYNPATGLHHVRNRRSYHMLENCNTVVAEWLRDLGCETRGFSLDARFDIRPQRDVAPAP